MEPFRTTINIEQPPKPKVRITSHQHPLTVRTPTQDSLPRRPHPNDPKPHFMTPTNPTRPLKNLGSFCRRLLTTKTPLTRITTTNRPPPLTTTTITTRQHTTPSHPLPTPTNRPSPPKMPSSPNPASTPPPPSSTSHPTNTNTTNPPPPTATTTTTTTGTLPALPALPAAPENPPAPGAGESAPQILRVDGAAVVLDHLGPMVIGRDGTVSRIANWGEMAAVERENTVRVLGRRNQVRLAALRGEQGGGKKE